VSPLLFSFFSMKHAEQRLTNRRGLYLELDLPPTGLVNIEHRVGIPNFNSPFCEADDRANQSSHFEAHYASQVALRRLCVNLHRTLNDCKLPRLQLDSPPNILLITLQQRLIVIRLPHRPMTTSADLHRKPWTSSHYNLHNGGRYFRGICSGPKMILLAFQPLNQRISGFSTNRWTRTCRPALVTLASHCSLQT
jgi:hypothetical protein